jgi:proline racemase
MMSKRMFTAIETHCGEPMRVVTGGMPTIPGNSVYEQSNWLRDNDDRIYSWRYLVIDANANRS